MASRVTPTEDAVASDNPNGEPRSSAQLSDNPPARDGATRNAFMELMSRKRRRSSPAGDPTRAHEHASRPKGTTVPSKGSTSFVGRHFPGRSGLEAYLVAPQDFPASRVVAYDEDWVLIKDLYPKASVHLLLLPRDLEISRMHPYDALSDAEFAGSARREAGKAARIAAEELRRMFGRTSKAEAARNAAMMQDPPPEELPPGRNWLAAIRIGIHTHPSMSNLHIHILSCDMHSPSLKHRKHYNSFNTDFFVPLDLFPLSEEEGRRRRALDWPHLEMRCWRCQKNFGNHMSRLKEHLEGEWKEWQQE